MRGSGEAGKPRVDRPLKWTTRRTAVYGLMVAFALVLSYIESLIPFFFGVPGMKLGLPNFVVVLLLYLDGGGHGGAFRGEANERGTPVAALLVNALRIALSGFLFGSLFGILFSLAGALVSLQAMALLKRTGRFGVVGVSILGGVTHNLGQLLVAVFVVRTSGIWYYAPFLILAGALTGLVIGVLAGAVLPYGRWIFEEEKR